MYIALSSTIISLSPAGATVTTIPSYLIVTVVDAAKPEPETVMVFSTAPASTLTTTSTGTFSATFSVPSSAVGNHAVQATVGTTIASGSIYS